ncbi:MAG: acyltransferase [Rhodospirillales bacterium]|nr:acyltransferase [Rhodospirillales bacterium]
MRQRWLDGLRGLAALNVMLSHWIVAFFFPLYTGLAAPGASGWEIRFSALPLLWPVAGANGAVCIFLVLSGYVLAIAYDRSAQPALALLARRWVRLGLPILAAVLLSWALIRAGAMANHAAAARSGSDWLAAQMRGPHDLAAALYEGGIGALIDRLDFGATFDSSLWTMPIEFAGSLALIAIFTAARRWRGPVPSRRQADWLLLFAAWLLRDRYLCLFAVGAGLYVLAPRPRQGIAGGIVCLLTGLVLGAVPYSAARGAFWDWLVAQAPIAPPVPPWPRHFPGLVRLDGPGFWHAAGAVLILLSFLLWPRLRSGLERPAAQFLGRVSFPLYLVHVPLLLSGGCRVFLAAHAGGLSRAAAALTALAVFAPLALGIATLAAALVEAPAIALSRRIGGERQ